MHTDNAQEALGVVPPRWDTLNERCRLLLLLLLVLLLIILNYNIALRNYPPGDLEMQSPQTSRDWTESPNKRGGH